MPSGICAVGKNAVHKFGKSVNQASQSHDDTETGVGYAVVTAYTLIIDEMQDFDYFFVKDGTWSYHRQTRWSITAGMDWDGYYVLANNIDATDYHVLDEKGNPTDKLGQFKGLQSAFPHINWNDEPSTATFATMGATRAEADMAKYGIAGKGMMGTFDGRGYVIDKYTPSSGGLFQYVNGGLIKDVGFTNVGCSGGGHGVLGDMILNGAQLDGIYAQLVPNAYKGKCVTIIAYNQDLSRKIYSGADIFLMPSKMEPCGLSQMIASRYGTVPVVRETGGLNDSIKAYTGVVGNGFTFKDYNAQDMLYVINEAIRAFKDKEVWRDVQNRAITTDFSWKNQAKEYEKMYQK